MKFTIICSTVFFSLAQAAIAATDIPDVKEGQWEITAEMDMPGMPVKLPPITHTQCITKENLVPENIQNKSKECKVSNNQMTANTVSWSVECQTKQGAVTGNGKINYQRETFNGTFKMNMNSSEGPMNMTTHMKGRYIGVCP